MELGGSERVMLNLLRHIDRNRFEAHLAVLQKGGARLQDLPARVQVHEVGVARARSAVFPIARLCWKLRPRVILSTSAHLNSAVIAARPLLPAGTILITREGADISSPETGCSRVRLLIYKHVYRRANLVICQSDYMKEDLIRKFDLPPFKVVRIYNPVDIDSITALANVEPNPFQTVGPNLVGVGRFSHEKGFDLLLKSMPLVREIFPSVALTLVGNGSNFAELKALQRELCLDSCVRFAGLRRNPYPFIKHADLLVLPSRCEAFPNVVLEAIALGTAVVASNCTGALTEISSCASRRLMVAKDRTPDALGAEISSALAKIPLQQKQTKSGPQFEARFGVRHITKQYEHIFLKSIREAPKVSEYADFPTQSLQLK
jgi:glycosyltransferase involved in cell wall biosynthesis